MTLPWEVVLWLKAFAVCLAVLGSAGCIVELLVAHVEQETT